jgi:hypothetical protein
MRGFNIDINLWHREPAHYSSGKRANGQMPVTLAGFAVGAEEVEGEEGSWPDTLYLCHRLNLSESERLLHYFRVEVCVRMALLRDKRWCAA